METVCSALELATVFDRAEFRQSLLRKVMESPRDVFSSTAFNECTSNTLQLILNCENLKCREIEVFNACIGWSRKACVKKDLDPSNLLNVRHQLGNCLYLIKFSDMQPVEISRCVHKYAYLFTREELVEIISILAADNKTLKYFVRKDQVVKSVEWKYYASMMFSQINFTECNVNQVEITAFKTNREVILGAVATQIISTKSYGKISLLGVMSIFELQENKSFEQSEILLEQPFEAALGGQFVPRNFTVLNSPVTIEPYKVYRVRIEFDSSWKENDCTTKKCTTFRKISIRNYSTTFAGGILSHLYFN